MRAAEPTPEQIHYAHHRLFVMTNKGTRADLARDWTAHVEKCSPCREAEAPKAKA